MEEKKKPYEAPGLTVVTFKTERGYATSTRSLSFNALTLGATAIDDDYMEAERTGYGTAFSSSWD